MRRAPREVKAWLLRRCRCLCPFRLLHSPRCRTPPCEPGRSEVPRPVLALASLGSPSRSGRRCRADPPPPLRVPVDCPDRALGHRPSLVRLLLARPRAPSPCALWGVTPAGRACPPSLPGCACPPRSSGRRRQSPSLRVPGARRLGHPVGAGGWPARRGVGPSRRQRGASCPAGLAPSPGGSGGARPRGCPPDCGLPHVRTGAALGASSGPRLQPGRAWRGCRPARLGTPTGVLATPGAPPTGDHLPWAARALPSAPLTVRSLPVPRIGSPSASGHGRQRTCTAADAQPCRRLPERPR